MTSPNTAGSPRFDRSPVRLLVKLGLGTTALVLIAHLLALLPGTELLPVDASLVLPLVTAVVGLAAAAVLVPTAGRVAGHVTDRLAGPIELVEAAGAITYWLVMLGALLAAHWGLSPLADALLGAWGWTVDLLALLLALPIVLVVAARSFVALDPAASLVTDRLVHEHERGGTG